VTSQHFALLQALERSGGLSLREAAAAVASATSEATGAMLADLMVWLPQAIDGGILLRCNIVFGAWQVWRLQ
jgi:hypothetical protein